MAWYVYIATHVGKKFLSMFPVEAQSIFDILNREFDLLFHSTNTESFHNLPGDQRYMPGILYCALFLSAQRLYRKDSPVGIAFDSYSGDPHSACIRAQTV